MVEFDEALMNKWAPVMVLYPDIADTQDARPIQKSGPPRHTRLPSDYHPRDIRLPIDNSVWYRRRRSPWSRLKPRSTTLNGDKLLAEMALGKNRDLDLLPKADQHKPEVFWNEYRKEANKKDDDGNDKYPRRCYASVHQDIDQITGITTQVLQYWYPYFYNDFFNKHEMDWENVQIAGTVVNGEWKPSLVAISAHHGGSWLPWDEVQKVEGVENPDLEGNHPVVYVAGGSHANYFYGPARIPTAPPITTKILQKIKRLPVIRLVIRHSKQLSGSSYLIDITPAWSEASPQLIAAKKIPEKVADWKDEWGWLRHPGKWGSPGGADLEFGDDGPTGPPYKGDQWDKPLDWMLESCSRPKAANEVVSVIDQAQSGAK